MGAKYANIQVRTKDIEHVKNAVLTFGPSYREEKLARKRAFAQILGLPDSFVSTSAEVFYLGQPAEDWTTLLNEDFMWESVAEFAAGLSKYMEYPLISIGYFDDDVFELNLFRHGMKITGILVCREGTAEDFGLERTLGNLVALIDTLELNSEVQVLEKILDQQVMNVVEPLEEELGAILTLKADWLDDFDEEIKSKFTRIEL